MCVGDGEADSDMVEVKVNVTDGDLVPRTEDERNQ